MTAGGGISVAGFVFSSQIIAVLGFCVALAGLAVNWYYQAKRDKREQAEHLARMARLEFPEA